MSFVSVSFLVLYLLALAVRWGSGDAKYFRIIALLALSWLFYAWHVPQYIFLILFSTATDYIAGRWIGRLQTHEEEKSRTAQKLIVLGSLVVNLGLLGWFKYAGFLVTSLKSAGEALASDGAGAFESWSVPDLVLPIGISFYTFQSLSYTIDVYRGKLPAEKDFARLACYIAFFPQLVAGPIVRAGQLLYQFDRRRRLRAKVFFEGGYLIVRGLFLKLVVADNLGIIVDQHWSQASAEPQGILAFSMLVFFACQLFCDFAGYSDIARGVAYQLGFRLPVNFNAPYIAATFSGFWRRWHITLSQWMRDYVYISMGGSRAGTIRVGVNLLLVMLISGLWHGANWTFVAWGGVLGVALLIERLSGLARLKFLPVNFLWFFVVQLVWIFSLGFFRSESIGDGWAIIGNAVLAWPPWLEGSLEESSAQLIALGWWFTIPVWLFHLRSWFAENTRWGISGRWERSIYTGIMLAAIAMLYSTAEQFIYFQF